MDQTEEEWTNAARAMAARHADAAATRAGLRDVLAELDALMRAASERLEDRYRRIGEPDLVERAEAHAAGFEAGLAWPSHDAGDAAATLVALAVQIRAVDAELAHADPAYDRKPSRAHIRSRWLSMAGIYVVPAPRGRDYGASEEDRHTYRRRGILRHRLIPAVVRGLEVEFAIAADRPATGEASVAALGAALLPGLVLDAFPTGVGTFLVRGVSCPGLDVIVSDQVARAHADRVDGAVWPELTIDDDALCVIKTALGERALGDAAFPPAVVVAGSWHRTESGLIYNSAPILSGRGATIGRYRKVVTYEDKEHGAEAIEPGRKLLVVVAERFIAAVGICKDYCDRGIATRWRELDVDLVLVPSMGDAKTMESHRKVAEAMRIYRDQRAFVVQQAEPRMKGDPLGYVLDAGRDVAKDVTATRMDATWSVHHL